MQLAAVECEHDEGDPISDTSQLSQSPSGTTKASHACPSKVQEEFNDVLAN